MEGASTTVYAQGGRGNARLVAWDGERTVTFTMEDALISAESFSLLASAKLTDPAINPHHITETVDKKAINDCQTIAATSIKIPLTEKPMSLDSYDKNSVYVMLVKDDEIISEPFIAAIVEDENAVTISAKEAGFNKEASDNRAYYIGKTGKSLINEAEEGEEEDWQATDKLLPIEGNSGIKYEKDEDIDFTKIPFDSVIVDYYTAKKTKDILITPDMVGGNFYLEAETLFRNQNGEDLPAVFTIPNCKIQSNFTLSMAASGDPSTFTFTMDAFPDYTYFDHSQKVFADIQIIEDAAGAGDYRWGTNEYWKDMPQKA